MRHGSLFSGIGGFDLAAEWMGWENVLHCEINPFGQQVLNYYWPNAVSYTNIITTDFRKHHGTIDIISGGFPCQPYSTAGKRLGKEDELHLWPEMLRAIREISPRWVVGENVRGLTNWNGGMVFDEVQADLEAEGYEVTPFLLPACGIDAPHRRDRIWFVAYSGSNGYQPGGSGKDRQEAGKSESNGDQRQRVRSDAGGVSEQGITTNPQCIRQPRQGRAVNPGSAKTYGDWKASWSHDDGRWPLESPLCSRNDGLSSRLSGITVSKHRNESIKAYGNAVVPQLVMQIFKAIEQYEQLK